MPQIKIYTVEVIRKSMEDRDLRWGVYRHIDKLIEVCNRMADIADEQMGERAYILEANMGCRALSSTLRAGIKEILDLKQNYYTWREKARLAEGSEEDIRDFIEELLGDREPDSFCKDIREELLNAIRPTAQAVMKRIAQREGWEVEDDDAPTALRGSGSKDGADGNDGAVLPEGGSNEVARA